MAPEIQHALSLHSENGNVSYTARCKPRADHDLNVLIESSQKLHQTLDRKLIQPVVLQRRDLRLRHVQQAGDLPLFQLARLQQFVDCQGQTRFGLTFGCVRIAKILEHVVRAPGDVAVVDVDFALGIPLFS